jgi:hypothetical protein
MLLLLSLHRRYQASRMLPRYYSFVVFLDRAQHLDPTNPACHANLVFIEQFQPAILWFMIDIPQPAYIVAYLFWRDDVTPG